MNRITHFITKVSLLIFVCQGYASESGGISVKVKIIPCVTKKGVDSKSHAKITSKESNDFPEFDREQPFIPHRVRNCRKKLVLTLQLENVDETSEEELFVMVDHAFDTYSGQELRITTPVVITVIQKQIIELYRFRTLYAVNAKVQEVILNNARNSTKCDAMSHTDCGIYHRNMKRPLKYTKGFCCPCMADKYGEPSEKLRGEEFCLEPSRLSNEARFKEYRSTAHCLKFSDFWYTVNVLEQPRLHHQINLKVFVRNELQNGSTVWNELTKDQAFKLNPRDRHAEAQKGHLMATYSTKAIDLSKVVINFKEERLLIPIPNRAKGKGNFFNGEPSEYLLVQSSMIEPSGSTCDTVGVSYEAFSSQQNPCHQDPNSCLKNQPLDLWEEDHKRLKEDLSIRTVHMLGGRAVLNPQPIREDEHSHSRYIAINHYSRHLSYIDMEIAVDDLLRILIPKHEVQLTWVVTSSSFSSSVVLVNVRNEGLASAKVTVSVRRCGGGSGLFADSRLFAISPRHVQQVRLQLDNIPPESVNCTVEVLSDGGEVLAGRRVQVQPGERCLCMWQCGCRCSEADGQDFSCVPLGAAQERRTGFRNPLPPLVFQEGVPASYSDVVFAATLVFCAICMLFLALGTVKAILGLCFRNIERFGLGHVLKGRRIQAYFEKEYKGLPVEYLDGHPVDPITKKPTVQRVSHFHMFLLNVIFFFCSAFYFGYWFSNKFYHNRSGKNLGKANNEYQGTTKWHGLWRDLHMIPTRNYDESRPRRDLDAESDADFVLAELKRSEELLRRK